MNKADIKYIDTINGYGLRVSLFISGCTIHCPHCFNKACQNFDYGSVFTTKDIDKIINTINDPNINYDGLSILGGEPLDSCYELYDVLKQFKNNFNSDKTIWLWSGRTLEENAKDLYKLRCLKFIDVLVDGPFINDLKDLSLNYRGSSNQRVIDMKETMKYITNENTFNKIILYNN